MFKQAVVSHQQGALVMAFVPFCYALIENGVVFLHLFLGLAWWFTYLFSYPFLSWFEGKKHPKYWRWMLIYAGIALAFFLPVGIYDWRILQFFVPILPLVLIQIYYAKRKQLRHLLSDIAAILIFGIVGIAAAYLVDQQIELAVAIHPSLFFIGTTLYVKSVARERKNPRYRYLSIGYHLLLMGGYVLFNQYAVAAVYLIGTVRAFLMPHFNYSLRKIGMLEFPMVVMFIFALGCG